MTKRPVYIYGLWDPRDSSLRYIGKTINLKARLHRHLVEYDQGKITHKSTWIKGLLNEGLEPSIHVLEEVTEKTWREAERAWIAEGREKGLRLTNMVDGGLGGHVRGKKHSKETRRCISEGCRGKPKPGLKGRALTADHKTKIGKANTGHHPRLGQRNTPEQNAKIGAANAIALKGRKLNEKEKKALRRASQARWARAGARERQREAMDGRPRKANGQFVSDVELAQKGNSNDL